MYRLIGLAHLQLLRAGRRLREGRGQGTVEYVALILLVALVMAGVIAAMKGFRTDSGKELGDVIVGEDQGGGAEGGVLGRRLRRAACRSRCGSAAPYRPAPRPRGTRMAHGLAHERRGPRFHAARAHTLHHNPARPGRRKDDAMSQSVSLHDSPYRGAVASGDRGGRIAELSLLRHRPRRQAREGRTRRRLGAPSWRCGCGRRRRMSREVAAG